LPSLVRRFRALTPGAEISLHPVAKIAQVEALRDGADPCRLLALLPLRG
jgi:hypothetical protein